MKTGQDPTQSLKTGSLQVQSLQIYKVITKQQSSYQKPKLLISTEPIEFSNYGKLNIGLALILSYLVKKQRLEKVFRSKDEFIN